MSNRTRGRRKRRRNRNRRKTVEEEWRQLPVAVGALVAPRPAPAVRVKHREFVRTIEQEVAGAFEMVRYPVNPGMEITFPWLSAVAMNFEEYELHSLKFYFTPRVGSNTTGSVTMVMDYDSHDDSPTKLRDLLEYEGCVRGVAWNTITFEADTRHFKNASERYFVRDARPKEPYDIHAYDVGAFFLQSDASQGLIGELWVEYDVSLHIPQRETAPVSGVMAGNNGVTDINVIGPGQPFGVGDLDIKKAWVNPGKLGLKIVASANVAISGARRVFATLLQTGGALVAAGASMFLVDPLPGDSITWGHAALSSDATTFVQVADVSLDEDHSEENPLVISLSGTVGGTLNTTEFDAYPYELIGLPFEKFPFGATVPLETTQPIRGPEQTTSPEDARRAQLEEALRRLSQS